MPPLKKSKGRREIVIIRHGETAMNVDNRIRAWSDIPLDAHGFEQAYDEGKKIKKMGLDLLIASDLTRTLQTAACISQESGVPIVATSLALRPLNVGKYTGQDADKVFKMIMEHAIEDPDKPFENGESFNSFKYRCLIGIIAFLNEYKDQKIGFVTHHRNDRLVRAWVEAGCPDDLELDLEHFYSHGISPGTSDTVVLESRYLR